MIIKKVKNLFFQFSFSKSRKLLTSNFKKSLILYNLFLNFLSIRNVNNVIEMLKIIIGTLLNPNKIKIREIKPSIRLANKNDEKINTKNISPFSFFIWLGNKNTNEEVRKSWKIKGQKNKIVVKERIKFR